MFRQLLHVQWVALRPVLPALMLAAFGLPLLFVQGFGTADIPASELVWHAEMAIGAAQMWVPLIPILALVVGSVVGIGVWSWDHRGSHVYALTLPLPRWEYAVRKMAAGWCFVILVVAFFAGGCFLAAGAITLPASLRAYPGLLAIRFLMVATLAYAVTFALASGTVRTVGMILAVLMGILVLNGLLVGPLSGVFPLLSRLNLLGSLSDVLLGWPGPLEVFLGNWNLIDV